MGIVGQGVAAYLQRRRERGTEAKEIAAAADAVLAMTGQDKINHDAGADPSRLPTCYICYCPADCATGTRVVIFFAGTASLAGAPSRHLVHFVALLHCPSNYCL